MAKGVGDVLYSILSNDSNISGIVSDKIYPFLAIEDVVSPYIVYTIEGVEPTQTDDGVSPLDVNGATIEIYSENLEEISTLSKMVRNALDRYKGTVEGIEVQSVSFQAEDGGYADDDRIYLKMQTYSLRMATISACFLRVDDLTATTYSATEIQLDWADVATGETGYEVWTSQDFINWVLVGTTSANASSYLVTGLNSASSYSYKIRAINATECGEWSNIAIGCTEGAIPDVNVSNSNDSYSVDINSDLDLPNINFTDSDGTTSSVPSMEDLVCSTPNEWLEIEIDTRISAVSLSDEFYLRLRTGSVATIDWESNGVLSYIDNITGNLDPQLIHKYPSPGVYTLKVKGAGFLQMQNADGRKITNLKNCGTFRYTATGSVFFDCANMIVTATDTLNISTNQIDSFFYACTLLVTPPLMNTSGRTRLNSVYVNSALNADLGFYDLRSCTDLGNFASGVSTWIESNYGNTLMGWLRWDSNTHAPAVGWVLKSNVSFHGGSSTLTIGSEAALARQYLIDILNWTITDGGLI